MMEKTFYFVRQLFLSTVSAVLGLASLQAESLKPIRLQELLQGVESKSSAFQLQQLEAEVIRRGAQSEYGKILPEIGVEGGARSSREKENRNDLFYYGYARFELSLGDIVQLRAALNKSEFGELARTQAGIRSQLMVIAAFYRVLALQKQLSLKTMDLTLADKQMTAARKRVDAGLAGESDVFEFKMLQQELQNDLRILEREFEFELRELERISGYGQPIKAVSEDFIFREEAGSFNEVWIAIADQNLELRRTKLEATTANTERTSALGEFLPRLTAEGQYGKLMETDFVESKKNSWEVVGKVTIPLFNGSASFRRYQERSAEAERATVTATQEEVRLKNVAQALYEKIRELKEKLKGEEQNVAFTEKYFEMVMSEYRRGVKNSPDVASATDKLFDARWRLMKTKIDLSMGTAELLAMQGKTLL